MTFEEWFARELPEGGSLQEDVYSGFYAKNRDVHQLIKEAYEAGWGEGYAEANKDKEYDV